MTIEDIIETLAKTDRPDGRIDAFITCAFHLKGLRPAEPNDFDGAYGYQPSSIKTEHGFLMAHSYTRDLNEATALCQQIVPDGFWFLSRSPQAPVDLPPYSAMVKAADFELLGGALSKNAALALTLAALRAHVKLKEKLAA